MADKMKFSILIPAYKKKYLKKAVESVLNQSYTDFELIIVNDCSPDNLDEIVGNFADDRIRYYKNAENCGAVNVVDNWNKCLEYASGDYVICMGDDDELADICLEEYEKLIDKYPNLRVYHTLTMMIDENSNVYTMQDQRPEWESVWSLIWHRWFYNRQQYIGDFCFETKTLKEEGGFYKLPLAWASDDITVVRAAAYAGIANTQKIGFYYRISSESISKSEDNSYKVKAKLKERTWYKQFLEVNRPINELDKIYYQMLLKNFDNHWLKQYSIYLSKDLAIHPMRIFGWYRKKKEYGFSRKWLFRVFKTSIKMR